MSMPAAPTATVALPQAARGRLRQATVRGGTLALCGNGVRLAITIASVAWLSRLLSPQEYGLYGIAGALIAFLGTFRDLGLSLAVSCERDITQDQASTAFWLNQLAGICLMLLCWAIAPLAGRAFGERQVAALMVCLAITLPIAASSIMHRSLLRRQLAIGRLIAIDVIALAAGTAVGIQLARCGAGVWSLVAMSVATESLGTAAVWVASPWRPGRWRGWAGIGALVRAGLSLQSVAICNILVGSCDKLLIGRFCGTHPLGLYTRAQALLTMPITQLMQPIGNVVIPAFSVLVHEPAAYRAHFLAGFRLIALGSGLLTAMMACCAGPLVAIVLGRQWSETAGIFAYLAVSMFNIVVGQAIFWLFASQGRTADLARQVRWDTVLALGSVAIGLPWGVRGVAASISAVALLIRVPLQYRLVGNPALVTTADLASVSIPCAGITAAAVAASYGLIQLSRLEHASRPLWLLGSAAIALVVSAALVASLPWGGAACDHPSIACAGCVGARWRPHPPREPQRDARAQRDRVHPQPRPPPAACARQLAGPGPRAAEDRDPGDRQRLERRHR